VKKNIIILGGIVAVVISIIFYMVDFLVFQDTNQLFSRLIDDLGFLPIDIFIVVIVVERLLSRQEKQSIMHKLNMVIGTFFSEVGNHLLASLKSSGEGKDNYELLAINQNWKEADFQKASAFAKTMNVTRTYLPGELEELKSFLHAKQPFLLRLLENPNLMEHESFTDLLWAVFHLCEELEARSSLKDVSQIDLQHINGDIRRIHGLLVVQWLAYSKHLQTSYPYLFSLVVRTQPFQKNPSASLG
jgi:hypothetical protein